MPYDRLDPLNGQQVATTIRSPNIQGIRSPQRAPTNGDFLRGAFRTPPQRMENLHKSRHSDHFRNALLERMIRRPSPLKNQAYRCVGQECPCR
jgi:hypothetical protein